MNARLTFLKAALAAVLMFLFPLSNSAQLFGGPKLQCFVLNAGEKRLEGIKKIAILNFEGQGDIGTKLNDYMTSLLIMDKRGITSMYNGLFSAPKDGKTYIKGVRTNVFQLVERSKLEKVLQEQKLGASGVIDDSQAAEIGKILGLDAIIVGGVSYTHKDEDKKLELVDKEGKKNTTITRTRTVTVEARMKIVSVSTAQILGTTTAQQVADDAKINEKISGLSPVTELCDQALNKVSWKLVNYIAPSFEYKSFEMKKIKAYKEKLSEAGDLIKEGDIDKAYKIYKAIFNDDSYNPAAAYNVGVLNEAVGNYEKALECYSIAKELEPSESDYVNAVTRAKKGVDLAKDLALIGMPIEKYEFEEAGSNALNTKKIKVKGGKDDRVEIHETALPSSTVVAKVPGGLEFEVIKTEGDWTLIKLLGGKQGYIHKSNVK